MKDEIIKAALMFSFGVAVASIFWILFFISSVGFDAEPKNKIPVLKKSTAPQMALIQTL
jgi:hypothetical protein